jgi:DNA-binding transcriptional LysR family regulator
MLFMGYIHNPAKIQRIVDFSAKVIMEMLREMAIFVQVVDAGSFSAAARQLGMTTSAVSRHVARLEAHIGARLLHRTTRSLALTELGQQVQGASMRMLAAAREVQAMAGTYSERPNGVIRVSAPVVFGQLWLAPRLPGFLAQYPDTEVRLTLTDRTVDLIEEGEDLAIRIARELAPGLAARLLFPMRYVLLATPAYLRSHGAPATPAELAGHRCIGLRHAELGREWSMRRGAQTMSVAMSARCSINNSAAVLAAVEAGGGIGMVTDFAAETALAAGRVELVLPDWQAGEQHQRSIHAVYLPGRHLALKIRAFIDYLVA